VRVQGPMQLSHAPGMVVQPPCVLHIEHGCTWAYEQHTTIRELYRYKCGPYLSLIMKKVEKLEMKLDTRAGVCTWSSSQQEALNKTHADRFS
jgi:hypothetical protein